MMNPGEENPQISQIEEWQVAGSQWHVTTGHCLQIICEICGFFF
jgi:hypothetical protein